MSDVDGVPVTSTSKDPSFERSLVLVRGGVGVFDFDPVCSREVERDGVCSSVGESVVVGVPGLGEMTTFVSDIDPEGVRVPSSTDGSRETSRVFGTARRGSRWGLSASAGSA